MRHSEFTVVVSQGADIKKVVRSLKTLGTVVEQVDDFLGVIHLTAEQTMQDKILTVGDIDSVRASEVISLPVLDERIPQ
ncbi:MAG: hypothetical protein AAF607_13890 [Pseudomonadota bacterium]